jgi:phage terminase large subunit-like protein
LGLLLRLTVIPRSRLRNEATFSSLWLRPYEVIPAVMNVYVMVDPSKGDTNRSDRTAIAVVGVDQGGSKYLLDGVRHRMKLTERWDYIKQFKRKWEAHPGVQMVRVGYERYGQQVDIEVINDMMIRENNSFEIVELGTPRKGRHAKPDRIERLEPDIREGRFYLPCVAYHGDFGPPGKHICYWSVWTEEHDKRAAEAGDEHSYSIGQVTYTPMRDLTKAQQRCVMTAQKNRIVTALQRRDENGDIYDLTRAFIDEMVRHPFAPHDDLIDATSRIYDIDPMPPQLYEAQSTEPLGIETDDLVEER